MFGQVDSFFTQTKNFGDDIRRNHFFNVTFDGRLQNGINLGGGIDTGTSTSQQCFVVDSPQELLYCDVSTPWSAQTQFKLYGSIPLPGDTQVSFTYQNLSGDDFNANLAYSSAVIEESLGCPLSGGARTATVPLVAPQTLFEDRITRLDFRLSKLISVERFRFRINFDAYNLFNTSSVRSVNSTYGSQWQRPNSIIDPRIIEIGGQIDF